MWRHFHAALADGEMQRATLLSRSSCINKIKPNRLFEKRLMWSITCIGIV